MKQRRRIFLGVQLLLDFLFRSKIAIAFWGLSYFVFVWSEAGNPTISCYESPYTGFFWYIWILLIIFWVFYKLWAMKRVMDDPVKYESIDTSSIAILSGILFINTLFLCQG